MSKSLALSVVIGSSVGGAIQGITSVISATDIIGKAIRKLNDQKIDIISNNKNLKRYEKGIKNIDEAIKKLKD